MKFILAPDSFKESMTAKEVADAMERGIKRVYKDADCVKVPMADGGEGTIESLVNGSKGKIYELEVMGPLKEKVKAKYGILGYEKTAVIEMAEASGIHHIQMDQRNPMITTTFGTGELIKDALNKGVKKIIIGIGGSATNDGGAGMIQALGGKLLDEYGNNLPFGGAYLDKLLKIDLTEFDRRIYDVEIEVACDVKNPLTGENGASFIFGKQKGADRKMMTILDNNLKHFSRIVKEQMDKDFEYLEGAGAAGGMGFALVTFCNAKLKPGIDIVIKYNDLEEKIKGASYVITGEGSIDSQTKYGKTPYGVAKVAKKYDVPVIAIAGNIGDDIDELYEQGISSIFSIIPCITTLDEALCKGVKNVENLMENIVRLL